MPAWIEHLRRSLSGRPQRAWPAGVVHHGVRILLVVVLAFAVHLIFPVAPVPDFPVLEVGMVAEEDLIAEVGFPVLKSDAQLAQEREEAAASVPPIFVYDEAAVDTLGARVERFLSHFDTIATAGADELRSRGRTREMLQRYGIVPDDRFVEILRSQGDRRALRYGLESAIGSLLPEGVATTMALDEQGAPQLLIRREAQEQIVPRDSIMTAPGFYDEAREMLAPSRRAELSELQRLILIRFFEPSLRYAGEATEAARERARAAVSPTKGDVLRGEKIVGAHEQIQEAQVERIRSYREALTTLGRIEAGPTAAPRAVGALLYNLIVLGMFGLLLFFYRREVYAGMRNVLLLAFLVLLLCAGAGLVGAYDAPIQLIPIALPALVIAVLWDGRMALILTLVLSVLLAGQTPFVGMSVIFTCAVAGGAAAMSVRVVRSRSQTLVFTLVITVAYLLAAVTLGLLRQHEFAAIMTAAGWGFLSALASAFVAMGALPLFEAFTRITTPQTLLELADLNRPLLQRLRKEAPGTFAHSISVAGIAEAAARAIDADALLTRVGIYYHDVGKVAKPQYFIENQHTSRNPHDKLKPTTSASIVRNHIIEGLRLADEARLPDSVRAFIAEHHGTQRISFFYDQARQQNPDGEIDPTQFSYPGPKPQSKETAIAMLADSVESAARVLQDPTPERIRELVDRIVQGKIDQGQLEETPLTFQDLRLIKDEFSSVLSGMYHQRIDYPPRGTGETEPAGAGARAGA